MKKLGLILLCGWVLIAAQETKLFWDGNDWLAIDRVTAQYPEYTFQIKNAYLSGLFDSKLFYQLQTRALNKKLADQVFKDRLEPGENRRLIQGLDAFYRDPARRYLPLPSALIATIMIQNELPAAATERYINESKKWINELMYRLPARSGDQSF
ncbi:MAG: hypothetical protein PHN44_04785 [Candidatus Marinimicrobia bacterium]|nr:hypothetical protein [Candidatus Neomarinimicrobiota bacterium]